MHAIASASQAAGAFAVRNSVAGAIWRRKTRSLPHIKGRLSPPALYGPTRASPGGSASWVTAAVWWAAGSCGGTWSRWGAEGSCVGRRSHRHRIGGRRIRLRRGPRTRGEVMFYSLSGSRNTASRGSRQALVGAALGVLHARFLWCRHSGGRRHRLGLSWETRVHRIKGCSATCRYRVSRPSASPHCVRQSHALGCRAQCGARYLVSCAVYGVPPITPCSRESSTGGSRVRPRFPLCGCGRSPCPLPNLASSWSCSRGRDPPSICRLLGDTPRGPVCRRSTPYSTGLASSLLSGQDTEGRGEVGHEPTVRPGAQEARLNSLSTPCRTLCACLRLLWGMTRR